jgi:hypothetical protein
VRRPAIALGVEGACLMGSHGFSLLASAALE